MNSKLPYDNTSIESICRYAKNLHSKSLEDIVGDKKIVLNNKNKGNVGNFIQEYWFHIKADNKKDQDFYLAGLELKCTPLKLLKNNSLTIKEPLSICAINLTQLDTETWNTSYLKHKINNILIIFHIPNQIFLKTVINKSTLFELKNYEELIKNDWLVIFNKNKLGLSHTLSAKDTRYLCTAPKSSDSTFKVKQPNSDKPAKQLGFRFKTAFMRAIYEQSKNPLKYNSLLSDANQVISIKTKEQITLTNYKSILLQKLNKQSNKSLGELCKTNNLSLGKAKDSVARLLNKFLGFKNYKARILELELEGINIKVVRHNNEYYPYESMSFPSEKIKELEKSSWQSSNLSEYLNTLLIVPLFQPSKDTKIDNFVLGQSFFWTPSDVQWEKIKNEWEMYRDEFINGKARVSVIKRGNKTFESLGITKSKDTSYIHMRPHGAKNSDRDEDSHGNIFCKQSFWLNKKFVQQILSQANS